MTEYFLISREELDKIVTGRISTKIEMAIRSRSSPAPTEVRTPDELLSIMREVINNDLMIQSLHQIIHEKLKIHDVTIGEEAAIVAATRKELIDTAIKNIKIYATSGGFSFTENGVTNILESLRSTPSAPEQEERR